MRDREKGLRKRKKRLDGRAAAVGLDGGDGRQRVAPQVIKFDTAGPLVSVAGVVIGHTAGVIADPTGLSGSIAGAMLSGVATSLPELVTALIILLNAILLLGMLYRQTRGPGNIGLESVLILVVYAGGFVVLAGMN